MTTKKTATISDVLKYLQSFEKRTEKHFNEIDNRFKNVDKRFNDVDKRFNSVDIRFNEIEKRFNNVDKDLHILKSWTLSEEKRFIKQEKLLFEWKSEIHNLIDKGFTKKAKDHDEEIAILNNRTVDLRNRLDRIEGVITV